MFGFYLIRKGLHFGEEAISERADQKRLWRLKDLGHILGDIVLLLLWAATIQQALIYSNNAILQEGGKK